MEAKCPMKHQGGVSEEEQPTTACASANHKPTGTDKRRGSDHGKGVYYCSYIGVDRLMEVIDPDKGLNLRTALLHEMGDVEIHAEKGSRVNGDMRQHDELFFIKMHQVYELWFHQLIAEIHSLIPIFEPPKDRGVKPEHSVLANVEIIIGRLTRVKGILKLLEPQITLMESLTPNSFLNFRDLLQGGSGFQSWQFRVLENIWGVEESRRQKVQERKDGKMCPLDYRTKITKDRERYEKDPHALDEKMLDWSTNKDNCLFLAVEAWLESLFDCLDRDSRDVAVGDKNESYWEKYCQLFGYLADIPEWADLHDELKQGFEEDSKKKITYRQLSAKAKKGALIVLANRGLPMMHVMNEILQLLLDVDNGLMGWRFKHREMVWRQIGHRHGTGQNVPGEDSKCETPESSTALPAGDEVTGVVYLGQTFRDEYRVYLSLADLSTFLLPRIKYTRSGDFKASFWPHCEENLVRRLHKLQLEADRCYRGHHGLREADKLQPRTTTH